MSATHRFFSRLRNFLFAHRPDHRLIEEMQQHLQLQTEENIRAGMSPAEARRQAALKFGPVESIREDLNRERTLPPLQNLLHDLRYAIRILRKSPAFTIAAVITLALGIGANTTVFSIVDAVLLRPLPYAQPQRIVEAESFSDAYSRTVPFGLSYPDFFDWRSQNRTLDHLVAYHGMDYTLTGAGPATHLSGQIVSWDLLPMLGANPELGRGFTLQEETPGTRVVLISHSLWQSQFGGDKNILGRTIHLSGANFTIIGVMPPSFRFPLHTAHNDIWATLAVDNVTDRGSHYVNAIGRLRPGVTVAQADADIKSIAIHLAAQYPDTNARHGFARVESELNFILGDTRLLMLIVLGAVALVLLIACGNIANLMLARLSERRREIAMRSALGATRATIIRQLLIESLTLSFLGGIAGCILAFLCTPLALRLISTSVPRAADAAVNLPVLGFSFAITLAAGILFGLVPAISASKTDLVSTLKSGSAADARGHNRLRSAVIIAEVALGIVLTSAAALLTTSLFHLMHQDLGFRPDHLLIFRFETPDSRYSKTRNQFMDDFYRRLRTLPGVQSAASTFTLPMTEEFDQVGFDDPEHPVPQNQTPSANVTLISPDYFRTMQTPILRGRGFSDADAYDAPQVMIINQAFADKFFHGKDPIGKQLRPSTSGGHTGGPQLRTIIAVVGNTRNSITEREPTPTYYIPNSQMHNWCCAYSVVRTAIPPIALADSVRHLVTSMDPDIPVTDLAPMDDLISLQLSQPRFATILLATFAGLALLLTVVGLYGIMMYSVSRRYREIGVRFALGAQRATVLRMVLRDAFVLIASGIAIGLVASIAFASVLRSMLYGTAPRNPLLLAAVCALVAITGLTAAWLPALRAASIEPTTALRTD